MTLLLFWRKAVRFEQSESLHPQETARGACRPNCGRRRNAAGRRRVDVHGDARLADHRRHSMRDSAAPPRVAGNRVVPNRSGTESGGERYGIGRDRQCRLKSCEGRRTRDGLIPTRFDLRRTWRRRSAGTSSCRRGTSRASVSGRGSACGMTVRARRRHDRGRPGGTQTPSPSGGQRHDQDAQGFWRRRRLQHLDHHHLDQRATWAGVTTGGGETMLGAVQLLRHDAQMSADGLTSGEYRQSRDGDRQPSRSSRPSSSRWAATCHLGAKTTPRSSLSTT